MFFAGWRFGAFRLSGCTAVSQPMSQMGPEFTVPRRAIDGELAPSADIGVRPHGFATRLTVMPYPIHELQPTSTTANACRGAKNEWRYFTVRSLSSS